MPRYRVRVAWSETVWRESIQEVEADDQDHAEEIASQERWENYDEGDSETNHTTYDVECLDGEEEEERPVRKAKLYSSCKSIERNLPEWF